MKLNFSSKEVIKEENSLFLAGPTPRTLEMESWRKEAIKILEDLHYNGVVYIPEREFDEENRGSENESLWEREALYNAKVIVFWVPRSIKRLPGFTTNIEFGYWLSKDSSKVVYGRPDDSENNEYLDWLYETETSKKPFNNLEALLTEAVAMTK